ELEEAVVARLRTERSLTRRRRRWRVAAVAGGIAAAAAVVIAVLVSVGSPSKAHGENVAFQKLPQGASASASLRKEPWGTDIAFNAHGLDPKTVYALWLGREDGTKVAAGTFQPSPHGDVRVNLESSLARTKATKLWATTPDGQTALLAHLAPTA